MSGKKLGLEDKYKNLFTTVNKNSPLGQSKISAPLGNNTLLSKVLETKPKTSNAKNLLKKVGGNFFKKTKIGRAMDLAVKVGTGVGAGYTVAKNKFKTDNKSGGGLSEKQKKIAAKAPPTDKLDGKDFAVLRAEKAKNRGSGLQDENMKPGKKYTV